jgi:hypothetical protein
VRSCSGVGFAAGWISNFKLIPLFPALASRRRNRRDSGAGLPPPGLLAQ